MSAGAFSFRIIAAAFSGAVCPPSMVWPLLVYNAGVGWHCINFVCVRRDSLDGKRIPMGVVPGGGRRAGDAVGVWGELQGGQLGHGRAARVPRLVGAPRPHDKFVPQVRRSVLSIAEGPAGGDVVRGPGPQDDPALGHLLVDMGVEGGSQLIGPDTAVRHLAQHGPGQGVVHVLLGGRVVAAGTS